MDYDIKLEDLSENHRGYASIIGIENLIALSKEYGGTPIYIPKFDELIKNKKYKNIVEEFDGAKAKHLAVKYGVSTVTVYKLVKKMIND